MLISRTLVLTIAGWLFLLNSDRVDARTLSGSADLGAITLGIHVSRTEFVGDTPSQFAQLIERMLQGALESRGISTPRSRMML